jgi:hypothetical protein
MGNGAIRVESMTRTLERLAALCTSGSLGLSPAEARLLRLVPGREPLGRRLPR